jgi:hypothetical protein
MKQKTSPELFFGYRDAKVLKMFLASVKATKELSVDGFLAIMDLSEQLAESAKKHDLALKAIFAPYPEIKSVPHPLLSGESVYAYKGHPDVKKIEKKLADLASKDLYGEYVSRFNRLSSSDFREISTGFPFESIMILRKYLLKPSTPK